MYKLIIFLVLFLLSQGCKSERDPDVQRPHITGVTVLEVSPIEVDEYYKTSGTVKAHVVSDIASRVMGTVTAIEVSAGDKVTQGELLLTIDDRDMVQKVRAAKESYKELIKALEAAKQNKNLLNLTYERYKNLYDEKVISQQEMDEIETRKEVSDIEFERAQASLNRGKAALEELEVNHDFTRIKSPVSGILTNKYVEIGNTAVPGVTLLRVEDNSLYRLEVMADETLLESLSLGILVKAHINALNLNVKGHISEIVPSIDTVTRSFLIKIDIDNVTDLRPGLYAEVFITYGKKEVILVPERAVVEKGQLVGVYTVDDKEIVNYRLIRVGRSYNGDMEVLSGLEIGDRVITDGVEKAIDGGVISNK